MHTTTGIRGNRTGTRHGRCAPNPPQPPTTARREDKTPCAERSHPSEPRQSWSGPRPGAPFPTREPPFRRPDQTRNYQTNPFATVTSKKARCPLSPPARTWGRALDPSHPALCVLRVLCGSHSIRGRSAPFVPACLRPFFPVPCPPMTAADNIRHVAERSALQKPRPRTNRHQEWTFRDAKAASRHVRARRRTV